MQEGANASAQDFAFVVFVVAVAILASVLGQITASHRSIARTGEAGAHPPSSDAFEYQYCATVFMPLALVSDPKTATEATLTKIEVGGTEHLLSPPLSLVRGGSFHSLTPNGDLRIVARPPGAPGSDPLSPAHELIVLELFETVDSTRMQEGLRRRISLDFEGEAPELQDSLPLRLVELWATPPPPGWFLLGDQRATPGNEVTALGSRELALRQALMRSNAIAFALALFPERVYGGRNRPIPASAIHGFHDSFDDLEVFAIMPYWAELRPVYDVASESFEYVREISCLPGADDSVLPFPELVLGFHSVGVSGGQNVPRWTQHLPPQMLLDSLSTERVGSLPYGYTEGEIRTHHSAVSEWHLARSSATTEGRLPLMCRQVLLTSGGKEYIGVPSCRLCNQIRHQLNFGSMQTRFRAIPRDAGLRVACGDAHSIHDCCELSLSCSAHQLQACTSRAPVRTASGDVAALAPGELRWRISSPLPEDRVSIEGTVDVDLVLEVDSMSRPQVRIHGVTAEFRRR